MVSAELGLGSTTPWLDGAVIELGSTNLGLVSAVANVGLWMTMLWFGSRHIELGSTKAGLLTK